VEALCDEIRKLNQEKDEPENSEKLPLFTPHSSEFAIPASSGPVEQAARAYYDEDLQPSNTLHYESRGAKIIDPHILTPTGKKVNNLVGRHEYVYTYTVEFLESASQIRCGMLVKTISGLDLGGASHSFSEQSLQTVEAGTKVVVKFRFKCLLNPGVYFLNAGVSGIVNGDFTYLARCIDVAMFRVQQEQSLSATGIVDLLVKPTVTVDAEVPELVKEIELI
jgi:lipopolysaccharide transport system ATP-binding protein